MTAPNSEMDRNENSWSELVDAVDGLGPGGLSLTGSDGWAVKDHLAHVAAWEHSLLALIAMCNADPRPEKIDVGVGVYRDSVGRTPILRAVKAAEKLLWERQDTKGYLGGRGDVELARLLRPIALGRHAGAERIDGVQPPGGCGANHGCGA